MYLTSGVGGYYLFKLCLSLIFSYVMLQEESLMWNIFVNLLWLNYWHFTQAFSSILSLYFLILEKKNQGLIPYLKMWLLFQLNQKCIFLGGGRRKLISLLILSCLPEENIPSWTTSYTSLVTCFLKQKWKL